MRNPRKIVFVSVHEKQQEAELEILRKLPLLLQPAGRH
jgi:hypothetical protein